MKDSFRSFNTISDDWLINIRGKLRGEAINFLKENLGDRMTLFELLDDRRGWITNALEMLSRAKYNYIFVWNEDHINIASQENIDHIVIEMADKEVDYLLPGFFSFWQNKINDNRKHIIIDGKYINILFITKENIKKFFPNREKRECIITSAAIFQKNFLRKIMKFEQHKLPMIFTRYLYRIMTGLNMLGLNFNQRVSYDFVNKFLFYKLRRFPKETPFEMEITNDRHYVLPIKLGAPKKELFVCIDDDVSRDGYSLIKKGLYPVNFDLDIQSGDIIEENNYYTVRKNLLVQNKEITERYYDDEIRSELIRKTILVISGRLLINVCEKKVVLAQGDATVIHTNLKHTIIALEDSIFLTISPNLKNKKIKYD